MKNNVPSILECESINLRFDVDFLCAVLFDPLDINFTIEMTNVANNGIIFHGFKVFASQDILATSCGDENVASANSIFNGGDFISFAYGLQSIDRIDLRDNDTTSKSSQHDISGPLDSIAKRFTATVQVVKLGLGYRVV